MDRTIKVISNVGKSPGEVAQLQATVIEELKRTLADEYMIQVKTQNYHWNVEGPLFFSLHKLFEEQYGQISKFVDETAEVIRSMGHRAPGSFSEFKKLSTLDEPPAEKIHSNQMIETLSQDHMRLAENLKERLEDAEVSGDISAVTLYENLISFHDKAAWMIRSHRS